MNFLIFLVALIQILFTITFLIASPIIIFLRIKERKKEKIDENKKDYSNY